MEGTLTGNEYERLVNAAHEQPAAHWEKALLPLIEQVKVTEKFNINNWEDVIAYIVQQPPAAKIVNLPAKRSKKWYWLGAASVTALLGLGIFLYTHNHQPAGTDIVVTNHKNDVPAPDKSLATVTLANGTVVYLDSSGNGQLAQQGNIQIIKLANGQIVYHLSAAQAGTANGKIIKEQYNTLTNPRGSRVIDMQLADGSHVWLNAGSSVTYPVAFTGNERRVELKGEGYFEVARNDAKKFVVTANGTTTEVLGTHFNVNAYDDEVATKITLLEGAVKVSKGSASKFIQPGQQAAIQHSSFIIHHSIDTEQVMAWKNGWFEFEKVAINRIMQQVSRWYNLDVVYRGQPGPQTFSGRISKELPLSSVLQSLEANGNGVKFSVEGRKLIVFF